MAEKHGTVTYNTVDAAYFEKRGLRATPALPAFGRSASARSSRGISRAGISASAPGGWGGLLIAAILIAIMYLGLVFCIAEMSPALPHTGAAYSFARTTMGPWGGFVTGLCREHRICAHAGGRRVLHRLLSRRDLRHRRREFQPVYWIVGYPIFVGLNCAGVELSFRVTRDRDVAGACVSRRLLDVSAFPSLDFERWALNIGAGPDGAAVELPEGGGPFLPFGIRASLAALPFAVWLFLAIEQLPLAAEESVDPKRDMPQRHHPRHVRR